MRGAGRLVRHVGLDRLPDRVPLDIENVGAAPAFDQALTGERAGFVERDEGEASPFIGRAVIQADGETEYRSFGQLSPDHGSPLVAYSGA